LLMLRLFFFSSRRRHTRSYGDWSSDVCSSDLVADCAEAAPGRRVRARKRRIATALVLGVADGQHGTRMGHLDDARSRSLLTAVKIGRASCRERGKIEGGEGA